MIDSSIKLTVGGDVQAKGGTYLTRPADEQLLQACLAGEFAYVLACRQIGKSSLKNAVAEHLIAQGIKVARIDLNRIGQSVKDAEDWYLSLQAEIARTLNLKVDIEKWNESQPRHSTLTQRFLRFLDEVVLTAISEQVVIFIDEIDLTLGLPFTGDFFAAIRTIHNDRAQNPDYHRLTFVLLGVATPDELISDNNRTPFNIGRAIPIRDFTEAECGVFLQVIQTKYPTHAKNYFKQIYNWTNGHPYLTQKLCAAVISSPDTNDSNLVNKLVKQIFLNEQDQAESNLQFVQTSILNDPEKDRMLKIYQEIIEGKKVGNDEKSPAINRLKLSGLIVAENDILKPRNKIYTETFNSKWIRRHLPQENGFFTTCFLYVFFGGVIIIPLIALFSALVIATYEISRGFITPNQWLAYLYTVLILTITGSLLFLLFRVGNKWWRSR